MVVTTRLSSTKGIECDNSTNIQENNPGLQSLSMETTNTNMADTEVPIAPNEQPVWFKKVGSNIDTLTKKLSSIENKIDGLTESVNFACDSAKEAVERSKDVETKVVKLENENARLKRDFSALKSRVDQIDSQSRRDNLIFTGIKEVEREKWSDCEKSVRDIITNVLKMENGNDIHFERVHRNGIKSPGRTRNIIAKFSRYKDREAVWQNRKKLSKSGYTLLEDFPNEVQNERKLLIPILKVAKTMNSVKSAYLKVDKLFINEKGYTTKTLKDLPAEFNLQKMFTKNENGVTLFCSKYSPLSNLYSESPIVIEGVSYCSTEQYIQLMKATKFNDHTTAAKIKTETDPYKIMQLGKSVTNFKFQEWNQEVKDVMKKANMAKFQQLEDARVLLLESNANMIGEATLDKNYGIGLHLTDPTATDPSKWASNAFGQILMEIRNKLKST